MGEGGGGESCSQNPRIKKAEQKSPSGASLVVPPARRHEEWIQVEKGSTHESPYTLRSISNDMICYCCRGSHHGGLLKSSFDMIIRTAFTSQSMFHSMAFDLTFASGASHTSSSKKIKRKRNMNIKVTQKGNPKKESRHCTGICWMMTALVFSHL